jgi:hypothetical protein
MILILVELHGNRFDNWTLTSPTSDAAALLRSHYFKKSRRVVEDAANVDSSPKEENSSRGMAMEFVIS